ncbi:MAG: ATP-binding cassette domain-containing protein [Oscillospiraceae bacterium]|nr:ATP-binding cassette domain-containing protein [Oscillospiraceae bacterium]
MGINIENVCKSYDGKKVLDNISFNMDTSGVFGLLGTNGAGKTTTIRIILGILEKDSGSVSWNGKNVTRENVNFGYLPEERGIYPKAKVSEQLIYFAQLKGMPLSKAKESLIKWAKKMKIEEYLDMPAEKLSKGNQQKVQFLTCVMHDPELMILDEPFSGMDPINTDIFKSVINELIAEGKYIIMSAHQMPTIEEFCKDIIIIDRGKTILKGNLKEIKDSYEIKKICIEASKDIDDIIKGFSLPILSKEDGTYIVGIDNLNQSQEVLKAISNKGIQVDKFELVRPTLYDVFVEKVGEDHARV